MDQLNLRIVSTHDIETNWNKLSSFVPKQGEIIVYDKDENFPYERFKIGDGITFLKDIPFTIDSHISSFFNVTDNVIKLDAGRIS